jgi:hypothetical protein
MPSKGVFTIFIVLALLFITLGDRVLPEPLASASLKTRTSANEFLVGLFPNKQPKNPNKRTEDAIQKQEQGQEP